MKKTKDRRNLEEHGNPSSHVTLKCLLNSPTYKRLKLQTANNKYQRKHLKRKIFRIQEKLDFLLSDKHERTVTLSYPNPDDGITATIQPMEGILEQLTKNIRTHQGEFKKIN